MVCVEFFLASWRSLDKFWTPLYFSRQLLACSWLIFFSPRIGKSTQESSTSKQEDIKKLLRRRQEAPRHVKKCHEVSKEEEVSIIFLKIPIKMSWLFPIDQEYWRSAKKSLRMIKNSSSTRFLFKICTVGQLLLDGQPEFNRIINNN